jgi:transcription initiation factor IIE alpha subunit
MSKLLNTFITKEHLPLKKFKHDVIEILFDKDEALTDEEIYARLRILKRTYEDVLEGKKDMTHWALQNIS